MKQAQIVFRFLVLADENGPKRLGQLCVRSTTQRLALAPALRLRLWASSPRARMCAVNPNSSSNSRTSARSYSLSTHTLRRLRCRGEPLHFKALQGWGGKLKVVAVGPGYYYAQGNAAPVGEQTALGVLNANYSLRAPGLSISPRTCRSRPITAARFQITSSIARSKHSPVKGLKSTESDMLNGTQNERTGRVPYALTARNYRG